MQDVATPWCRVEAAVRSRELRPGDVVVVHRGTYRVRYLGNEKSLLDECWMEPQVSGTAERPITLRASDGRGSAVLDARFDVRDHDGDGTIDQRWVQCTWSGDACGAPCRGVPDQAACEATWHLDYRWAEQPGQRQPFPADQAQLWDGETLIPSATCHCGQGCAAPCPDGDRAAFARGGRFLMDLASHRLFYRPASAADPNTRAVRLTKCNTFFGMNGKDHWVFDGLTLRSAVIAGWRIGGDRDDESVGVTIRRCSVAYTGMNACNPKRDGTNGHGVSIAWADRVTVEDSELANDVSECVHVSQACSDRTCGEVFRRNHIHHCGADPGWNSECANGGFDGDERAPGVIVRGDGGVYEDNLFEANDDDALSIEGDGGGGSEGRSWPSNLVVRRNRFVDNTFSGVLVGCQVADHPARGTRIVNNVFLRSRDPGLAQLRLAGNCDETVIANNSFFGGAGAAVDLSARARCTSGSGPPAPCDPHDVLIANNLAAGHGGPALVVCPSCQEGLVVEHNDFFAAARSVVVAMGKLHHACADLGALATANQCADPLFVAPARNDLRLRPGSPAIDAGRPVAGLDDDLDGRARPVGRAWDMGAYEGAAPEAP